MLFVNKEVPLPDERTADVLLVGGGTCGLVLADALRRHGLTVTVAESGAQHRDANADGLNAAEQSARHYRGATEGRRRCLGGTSLLWGGALLPFMPHDLAKRDHLLQPRWPLEHRELAAQVPELERLFRLAPGAYDSSFLDPATVVADGIVDDDTFVSRFAKWPSFARRNTALLLAGRLRDDPDLHVYLDTTVHTLQTGGGQPHTVTGVQAIRGDGQPVVIRARRIVLCAGAIESTRLLLQAQRGPLSDALATLPWLGRGFHDHISMHVAEVHPTDRVRLNRLAGFRFQRMTMRSFRLELTAAAQSRDHLPSAWAHIGFECTRSSAFDALRSIMQRAQQGHLPNRRSLFRLAADAPYLMRMAAWRVFRSQLCWPREARYLVTVVGEQLPRRSNSIELSSQVDRWGQPLPRINWNVDARDMETIRRTAWLLRRYWHQHCEAQIGPLRWLVDPDNSIDPGTTDFSDIFHPGGTTRMGVSSDDAVVDGHLRVLGTHNLYVLSTSVFPTGASANPTMTLLLLGLRLARQLQRDAESAL